MDSTTAIDTVVAVDKVVFDIVLVLLGSILTLSGYFFKGLVNRRTHSSNKIFERRLASISNIWTKYNELIWLIGPSIQLGYEDWKDQYFKQAQEARREFKKEVESQQIVLDQDIVEGFVSLGTEAMMFMHGNHQDTNDNPIGYHEWYTRHLNPRLEQLSDTINRSIQKRTHTISLEFREGQA